jgi:ammonia channel protein AmtB
MLVVSLSLIFIAFCIIMGYVLMFCIRERRMVDSLEPTMAIPMTAEEIEREDSRIVIVLFGAIIVGAALALITGYLVFFSRWS